MANARSENNAEDVEIVAVPATDTGITTSQSRTKLQTTLIIFALCMAVFLGALDTTIITTALPTIAVDLKASDSGYAWIGSAYLIGSAASMPFWGKISDIFGRKPIVMLANTVFLVGSLISAQAKDISMLLAGRAIQGVGGGGLIVLPNIVISDMFSQRERGLYLGLIGGTWSLASAIGPVIGGAFAENVSWRWCFYLNLPCDGLSLILLALFLKVHSPRTPLIDGLKAIDWLGALTVTGGTLMFLLGLEFAGVTHPWSSATVICLIVFGVVVFGIFLLIETSVKYPLMPLRIFESRSAAMIFTVCVSHGIAYISFAYFLPLYFQAVLGATPIVSGVWALVMAGVLAVTTIGVGVYIQRTGKYLGTIYLGTFFLTLGFGLWINSEPYRSWPRIVIYQIVVAVGMGALFQPPLLALQANLSHGDIAVGTATFGFLRMLSTSISVVVGQVIFQSRMATYYEGMRNAGISPQTATTLARGDTVSATFLIAHLSQKQQFFVKSAITNALQRDWIFYTVVAFVGFVASFGIQNKELSRLRQNETSGLKPNNEPDSGEELCGIGN